MEPITALFILGLYKATETIWKKGFDAAWEPVDEALKTRFTRWAGQGKEAERRAAFVKAAEAARANTLRTATDPQQAERILDALNGEQNRKGAQALAEEGVRLMLFSAIPDVPRLTRLCQERLRWDAVWGEGEPPTTETIAVILSDFLANLREALLDQEPYHDLIEKDMRRTLSEILVELRPVPYDDEATYRSQMAEVYRQLEFVGIPELREHRSITMEDVFIHLRVSGRGVQVPDSLEVIRSEVVESLWHENRWLPGKFVRDSSGAISLVATRPVIIGGPIYAKVRDLTSTDFSHALLESVQERVEVSKVLCQAQHLVVLGDPGAGKTTLLKYLTVICAEGRAEAELGLKAGGAGLLLPIFVPLREFAAECAKRNEDYCLLDYFYTHTREHLMLNLPRDFFEEVLKAGRCLVCLDGLDEVWVPGQRKQVGDAVRALATRFPGNRYIVTSRVVGYEEAPLDYREFAHHVILPLEDSDIREFVHKWYEVRERDPVQRKRKMEDLIATIEREPRIRDLARNPLLLTIIALVHHIEAELPHERVKLYDKCVTTLVDTWEEVKGLTIEEKQRPLYRQRRRLLERLAYELHVQAEKPGQLRTIKGGDLELLLTRFLMENRRLGYADDPDGARDEARAFIRLARGRTGLLMERGEGVFGFPHLTFQEYLAACDIENRCIHHGVDAIWGEIEPHLHDSHWQEVILLLLGSLNKYDEPPTLLVKRILESGEEDEFEPVLHRHLYMATRALADRVSVADTLHRRVVDAVLEIAHTAPVWEAQGACTASSWLVQDQYAAHGLLALIWDAQVDGRVRHVAASALGRLGHTEETAEILLALACSPQMDAGVRSGAAEVLGQLGHTQEAAEVLLTLARDVRVDDSVRYQATHALGQLNCAEGKVLHDLLALARDAQVGAGVRSAAASALGQLGHTEDKVLSGLLALALDTRVDDEVRRDTAYALGELGHAEEAADIFLALARDAQVDDSVRYQAASALGRTGGEALDSLLALALDAQVVASVRYAATSALGHMGRAEEKVLDGLLALARDAHVEDSVRSAAATALGELGRNEEAAEILLALARDAQVGDWVRQDAAEALGQLGRAEVAADILLALARDKQMDDGVRGDAAFAAGQLGRTAEATEVLVAIADDAQVHAWVRSDAAYALGQLGRVEDNVLDSLLALARDMQVATEACSAAAEALGQLGCANEKVLSGLLALASDVQAHAVARLYAVEALGQLGRADEKVLGALLALAHDTQVDDWIHRAAYESLKRLVGETTESTMRQ